MLFFNHQSSHSAIDVRAPVNQILKKMLEVASLKLDMIFKLVNFKVVRNCTILYFCFVRLVIRLHKASRAPEKGSVTHATEILGSKPDYAAVFWPNFRAFSGWALFENSDFPYSFTFIFRFWMYSDMVARSSAVPRCLKWHVYMLHKVGLYFILHL